tara:strand:+ start:2216 stop:2416 length:201 start_codon:yes stop_codon:yes gene_type:complete
MTLEERILKASIDWAHKEWKFALKAGDMVRASNFKEHYRSLVMKKITKEYHWEIPTTRIFPLVNLN